MKQDRDDFTATIIGLILGWWGGGGILAIILISYTNILQWVFG